MHVLPIPCKEQSHCSNSIFQSVKVFELLFDLGIFSEYLSDSIIYNRVYFTRRGPANTVGDGDGIKHARDGIRAGERGDLGNRGGKNWSSLGKKIV